MSLAHVQQWHDQMKAAGTSLVDPYVLTTISIPRVKKWMLLKALREHGKGDYDDLVGDLEDELKQDCYMLGSWKKAKAYLEAGSVELNDHRFILELEGVKRTLSEVGYKHDWEDGIDWDGEIFLKIESMLDKLG